MMAQCVLVDWGSTSLRAYRRDLSLIHESSTAGVLSVPPGGFSAALEVALMGVPASVPAVICGMAGSTRGWREVPYVPVPATLSDVVARAVRFTAESGRPIVLLPGVSCASNVNGQPDVMRGEEAQIFGAVEAAALGEDCTAALFCLPGTHTKWALVTRARGGAAMIAEFNTCMVGELFAVLTAHSVLASSVVPLPVGADPGAAFLEGLAVPAPLHALFSARARDVSAAPEARGRVREGNADFISGALLALELREAREWVARSPVRGAKPAVHLVGSAVLCGRYAAALGAAGWATPRPTPADTTARGLALFAGLALGDGPVAAHNHTKMAACGGGVGGDGGAPAGASADAGSSNASTALCSTSVTSGTATLATTSALRRTV